MASVAGYLKSNRRRHLDELSDLLSIPSVSTDPEHTKDVARAGDWIRRRMKRAGCTTAKLIKTDGHPIVYGEWLGAKDALTVLVYGHYDVQPVDPLELWDSSPFEPTIKGKRIYARGASDDKGQVIVHLNALEAHLETHGTCPINMKFLIEGEEEIGSPNLEPFIRKSRKLLACDVVVVSDTAMFAKGQPSICYGLRGLAYIEVEVRGTHRDLHSGVFGGAVVNPANALTQMLGTLKDAKGRITVPGFYENVRRLSVPERRRLAKLPHTDHVYRNSHGAPDQFGAAGYTTLERSWARPSLDINGIWSGFTGEGAKTVIPAIAHAKVSMRLVPDQTASEISHKVGGYLKRIAPPSVKVTVRDLHGGEPWIASTDLPMMQSAARALKKAFGREPVFAREGGSIPVVATFDQLLKVPTLLVGFGLQDDNLHAPNEKMELDNFYRGIATSAFLIEELATHGPGKATRHKRGARG